METFEFDGQFLWDLGAVIAQRPKYFMPARDVNLIAIPFLNGDIIVDNGRYNNITAQIPIRAVPSFCRLSFKDFAYKLSEWLNAETHDYKIYRDTYNPGFFRKGVVTEISEITAVYPDVYETKITFSFEPFLFSDSGLNVTRYQSTNGRISTSIVNPEMWSAEPIIRIIGSGNYSGFIGNVGFTVNDVVNEIVIDKQNENVYDAIGRACNNKISANKLPSFSAGSNAIQFENTDSLDFTMEITPNWRRI